MPKFSIKFFIIQAVGVKFSLIKGRSFFNLGATLRDIKGEFYTKQRLRL